MTADVELLPLPNSGSGFYEDNVWRDTFSKRQVEAYARGNMEPLITEIETLRNEVSWMRAARLAYASEFPATEDGDPDTGNIHANIRALKTEIEEMRAERDSFQRVGIAAQDRAERLEEALRDAAEALQVAGLPGNAKHFRSILRDHDKEDRNG